MLDRDLLVRDWCKADKKVYGGFFKRISISYPAASLVSMSEGSTSMLHGILQGQQVTLAARQMLEDVFPALHILCAEAGLSEVPDAFRPLLQQIVQKATVLREYQVICIHRHLLQLTISLRAWGFSRGVMVLCRMCLGK